MVVVNNIQADILDMLAKYKFLTNSQLSRVTGKSIGYIREQVAHLVKRGYIKAYHLEKATRTEHVQYLSEAGKQVLLQNHKVFADDIKIPIGVPLVVRDYQHRKNFIDVQISTFTYAEKNNISIEAFHAYYDKVGNNRTAGNLEAKTKILLWGNDFYMPDGVMITDSKGDKEMLLIEMYNGKDTGRTKY